MSNNHNHGDVNAKIGRETKVHGETISREGCGERNDNGQVFLEYCHSNNLDIGGSIFPHKNKHTTGDHRKGVLETKLTTLHFVPNKTVPVYTTMQHFVSARNLIIWYHINKTQNIHLNM